MLKYLAPALCLLALPALAQGTSIKKMDPALDNVLAPGTKIENTLSSMFWSRHSASAVASITFRFLTMASSKVSLP